MKTSKELYAEIEALQRQLFAKIKEASDQRQSELREKPVAERIVYAAISRCPCGAGLAYDPAGEVEDGVFKGPCAGFWDCSRIILGTADKDVKHTDRLPFAFYDVKSECQASANGETTRPN